MVDRLLKEPGLTAVYHRDRIAFMLRTFLGEMVQVESEAIGEILYDADTSRMFVRFIDGDWYTYFAVSARIYEAFVATESHGRFFHERIRDRFPFRRGR